MIPLQDCGSVGGGVATVRGSYIILVTSSCMLIGSPLPDRLQRLRQFLSRFYDPLLGLRLCHFTDETASMCK
jgi:hypothetical protein